MLTSTNRSRKFPENVHSQIASNLDNWQIVILTNQSLHSNSFEALYGPFLNLTPPSWWHLLSASAFVHGPWHASPGIVIAQCIVHADFFNAMQTSNSASSWRDFWKWVTLLPFCISSSACAVLERLSNMEHTSCCLMKNMVNIVIQCYRAFFLIWYIPQPLFAS